MMQDERRVFLIRYLLDEDFRYRHISLPDDVQDQRDLLRSLMNVREPKPIGEDFLSVQDEYLRERSVERGITDGNALPCVPSDKKICIWQGDITLLRCDGIVNACNSQMLGCFSPLHGCIDNFIHTYAGVQLRLKMAEIMKEQGHDEPTGMAKITSAYNLPSNYILHTLILIQIFFI